MTSPRSKLFKNCLTDYDNETYDTGRVLAFAFFLSSMFYSGWDLIVLHNAFDVQKYLLGGGTFLTGLGFYLFGDGKGRREAGGTNNVDTSTEVPKG